MIGRLRQLPERVLFRPGFSLLLFGALSLLFNWLWTGSGLFLGGGLGLSIWLVSLMATVVAAMALIRRRLELAALLVLRSEERRVGKECRSGGQSVVLEEMGA